MDDYLLMTKLLKALLINGGLAALTVLFFFNEIPTNSPRDLIITSEELFTGGTYGDATVDGATYGFGFRSKASRGFQTKVEFNYTDWDKVTLTNTNDSAADTIVTATPEVWSAKIAVGYNY